jgi:hypothetical protein
MKSDTAPAARPRRPVLRWMSVVLRGAHLVAVIGLGASLLGAPLAAREQAMWLLATGVTILAFDLRARPGLLGEWSGISLVLKLGLVAWMAGDATWRRPLYWLIVAWSVLFAHAPASFRHARWWPVGR